MTSRTWIKVFCENWLSGSIREEEPAVRSVFIDLLTLADRHTGEVKLTNNIGYTDQQLTEILKISKKLWRKAKQRFQESQRIEISPKGAIKIINWDKYQSEYARQKPYRRPKTDVC
jgi:hypothetical protein